jgi:hypothetical protein
MSQENVDRFAKVIEAFNRMDIPGVLRFMDPEVQSSTGSLNSREATPGRKPLRGSSRMSLSTSTP